MLCLFEIDHQGPCGAYAQGESLHRETFQGFDAELAAETVHGCVIHESPFVDRRDIGVPETLPDPLFAASLDDKLAWGKGREQRADVLQGPFGDLELSGRGIEECGSAAIRFENEAAEEVVLLLFQHVLAERKPRGDDFRNPPLDKFLRETRVLQLVAYRNLVSRPDELVEIVLDGVMRESGHGDRPLLAI